MIQSPSQWIAAAILASIVIVVAYRYRALSLSGAVAAVLLGTVVVGTGGWWPGIILVVFFITSSLLSRSDSKQARGSRRDWVQVLSNGWGMVLGCILYAATCWEPWLFFGIGAIAAATADTWSSEIGRRNTSPPRLITTWKPVPAGTSGAISLAGTLASIAGSLLIATITALAIASGALTLEVEAFAALIGITLAGVGGAFLDSVLGATVQEQRWCDSCKVATEANPHHCGTETRPTRGIEGFNNDVVNISCILAGALIGLLSGIL